MILRPLPSLARRAVGVAFVVAGLGGCADDPLYAFCTDDGGGFDIDEVSALEGNLGMKGLGDAVVLSYDDERLADDKNQATWRVTGVSVLVMIPERDFDSFGDRQQLEVQVFDGADPTTATLYKVRQTLVRSDLTWTPHTFDTPPEGTKELDPFGLPVEHNDVDFVSAWWPFDFEGVLPEDGMQSTAYVVGVYWPKEAVPLVGYSLYNRSCADNWSNYDEVDPAFSNGASGWVANDVRSGENNCNWPMLKVDTELRTACQK